MGDHLDAFEPPGEDESALRFAAESLSAAEVIAAAAGGSPEPARLNGCRRRIPDRRGNSARRARRSPDHYHDILMPS
jgi:hypothetical protein